MPYQYLGITGISDKDELAAIVKKLGDTPTSDVFRLSAGILLSDKTFNGGVPPTARFPRMPDAFDLMEIIPPSWQSIIHYSTRSAEPLSRQLSAVFRHRSIYNKGICRAVQLNVKSPDPSELARLVNELPELEIVIQVPLWREDLQTYEDLLKFVQQYADINASFLFDPSGGRGAEMDLRKLQMISKVVASLPVSARNVFAGGLSGENVVKVCEQIYDATQKAFSIDAEGKLRGGKFEGRRIGDKMNPDKVSHFLREACKAFHRVTEKETGACYASPLMEWYEKPE